MNNEGIKAVLIPARARLARPGSWIREHLAMHADGGTCGPRNPNAVAFCAYGAILAGARRGGESPEWLVREFLLDVVNSTAEYPWDSISAWNDDEDRTREEVLLMFDRAIELCG